MHEFFDLVATHSMKQSEQIKEQL